MLFDRRLEFSVNAIRRFGGTLILKQWNAKKNIHAIQRKLYE